MSFAREHVSVLAEFLDHIDDFCPDNGDFKLESATVNIEGKRFQLEHSGENRSTGVDEYQISETS